MTLRSKVLTIGDRLETMLQDAGYDVEFGSHSEGKYTISDMLELLIIDEHSTVDVNAILEIIEGNNPTSETIPLALDKLIDEIEDNLHLMGVSDAEYDEDTGILALVGDILEIINPDDYYTKSETYTKSEINTILNNMPDCDTVLLADIYDDFLLTGSDRNINKLYEITGDLNLREAIKYHYCGVSFDSSTTPYTLNFSFDNKPHICEFNDRFYFLYNDDCYVSIDRDRLYTKQEVEEKLLHKSDIGHHHYKSQIDDFGNYQAPLVSGTNIKTVNNNSLLGSGNLRIREREENILRFTFVVDEDETDFSTFAGQDNPFTFDGDNLIVKWGEDTPFDEQTYTGGVLSHRFKYAGTYNVTITGDITSINLGTFRLVEGITNVTIPNSVTVIGDYCFYGCTDLVNVNIPSTVTTLGSNCFKDCTSLTNLTIPSNIVSLGDSCFRGCNLLDVDVVIPSNVTSLGSTCFDACNSLNSIRFESINPPTAGTNCFRNIPTTCKIIVPKESLNSYINASNYPSSSTYTYLGYSDIVVDTISDGEVHAVSSDAVHDALANKADSSHNHDNRYYTESEMDTALNGKQATLVSGTNIKTINNNSLLGNGDINIREPNENLLIFTFIATDDNGKTFSTFDQQPNPFVYDGDSLLVDWGDGTTTTYTSGVLSHTYSTNGTYTITITGDITSLKKNCFALCNTVTSIVIPNSVTSLGEACFIGCFSLTNIVIPNSVTSLGLGCFNSCNGLTNVIIPNSVTSLEQGCFIGCSGLNSILFESINPPTAGTDCFKNVPSTCKVIVPKESITSYTSATNYPDSSTYTYLGHSNIVVDSVSDGVIYSPSSDVIYDALNGKANTSHTHTISNVTDYPLFCECTGGVSTTAYVNILEINVTESNKNAPITMAIRKKGNSVPTYISIKLSNIDITQEDYYIDSFISWGEKNSYYLRQSDTNKFVLIGYKGANNSLQVTDLYNPNSGVSITVLDTNYGSTPSSTSANPVWTATYTVGGTEIIDNLTTDNASKVLSAKQGKELKDLIGNAITYINQ